MRGSMKKVSAQQEESLRDEDSYLRYRMIRIVYRLPVSHLLLIDTIPIWYNNHNRTSILFVFWVEIARNCRIPP